MPDEGLGDWRFEAVTTLAQDLPAAYSGGPSHKAGTRVFLTTVTRNEKDDLIGFITPSAVALALNVAIGSARRAEELRPKVPYVKNLGPNGIVFSVPVQNSSALFDFFEQCMISATFSFRSIEAFCNHAIGRNLNAPLAVKTRRGEELLSVDDLERKLSTEEKIGDVLPKILGVPTPRGKAVWHSLKQLQKVRDSIIHLKRFDQNPMSDIDKQSLFFQLLNHNPIVFPDTAIALVSYFYNEKQRPRWLSMAPPTKSAQ